MLLIITGVTLSLALGDEGIIGKAQEASNMYANATMDEKLSLAQLSNIIKEKTNRPNNIPTEDGVETSVVIQMVEEQNQTINGSAIIKIYSDSNCTNLVDTITLNPNATLNINAGEYYVVVDQPPDGYTKPEGATRMVARAGEVNNWNISIELGPQLPSVLPDWYYVACNLRGGNGGNGASGNIDNVEVSVYKVGTKQSGQYVLDSPFDSSSVDLNTISSTEDRIIACRKLLQIADTNGLMPYRIGTSDKNGSIVFGDMEEGVYVICKSGGRSELIGVNPTLIELNNTLNGGETTVYIGGYLSTNGEGLCSISTTLSFKFFDGAEINDLWTVYNDHFSVGLFYDPELEAPASEIILLPIENSSSGTVTFDNVEPGSYYIGIYYDGVIVENNGLRSG